MAFSKTKVIKTQSPHRCFGCWYLFPPSRILLIHTGVSVNGFFQDYFCQDCWHEFQSWDWRDQEGTTAGDVGYWVGDQWFPMQV